MEPILLKYNTEICLRSKKTEKYFQYDKSNDTAHAQSTPPYITIVGQQNMNNSSNLNLQTNINKLKIIEQKEIQGRNAIKQVLPQQKQFITFGSKVHFVNSLGEYLIYSSKNQLKFDKITVDDNLNAMLFKTATWIIIDIANTPGINRKPVSVYDDIVLKNVYNKYLVCLENLEVNASGQTVNEGTTWNIMKADIPYIPAWVYQRPAFTKFICLNPQNDRQLLYQRGARNQKKSLANQPPNIQQMLLIEDILDIMLGFQGTYIKKQPGKHNFVIQPHLQHSSCSIALLQLTEKILELPRYYYIIQSYISAYSIQQGTVCQALCGGLRVLIKQYKMMVIQLDQQTKNGLTLQKIWYLIQPSIKVMRSLYDLVNLALKLKGGQLLSCIMKIYNTSTDQKIIDIYNFLFHKTLKVYMQMVSKWIYQGVIQDKHQQFMITNNEAKNEGPWISWEQAFQLRKQQIPILFQKQSEKILVTGKYLNIIKACAKGSLEHPFHREIQNNLEKYMKLQDFTQGVHRAYDWANQQLQNLIFKQYHLIEVLKSMKGYFFLQFGDFFIHLMEAADKDLSQIKSSKLMSQTKARQYTVSADKLQSLFQLLIRTSSANNDAYKQQVSCRIDNTSLYEHVHKIKTTEPQTFNFDYNQKPYYKKQSRYVDFFTLDYRCVFPLNMIINKQSLSKYQALFRFIFWCKYIQKQLNNVWLVLQSTKMFPMKCYQKAYLLNQRMINYAKNLTYYLSYQIIEQNWLIFMQNLKKVKNFEDIIHYHEQFLNKCLMESLIMNNKLFPIITIEIGNACQGFLNIRNYVSQLSQESIDFIGNPSDSIITQRLKKIQKMKEAVRDWMQHKNFEKIVNGYSESFDNGVRKLLRQVYGLMGKQDSFLVGFLDRMDEEKYYNKKLFNNLSYA